MRRGDDIAGCYGDAGAGDAGVQGRAEVVVRFLWVKGRRRRLYVGGER